MTGNEKTEQIVYISCVEEVRYSFVSHLSDALTRKGIDVFVDSDDLRSEEAQEIVKRARVSVMVLPGNLEPTTACLGKLLRVLECKRRIDQMVVPVLYGIGTLEDDWRRTLQKISGLSQGHQSRKECTDSKLVEEIARDVYENIYHIGRIGIYPKLLEIEQMVCKQQSGIRCVGIWGMPGIGKTTLAKAVFDQMSGAFDARCFIKDYDKAIREKGLYRVLEEQFLKEKPGAGGTSTKLSLLRDKLNNKKVLVVLDGVCNPLVAESFLRGFDWFGPESLIVITSRDKQVFRLCRVSQIYNIQGLNEKEALQLFSLCASINDIAEQNLHGLSMEVIEYANGNPLALSIYGRELKGKKVLSEMQNEFLSLKRRPPSEIVDVVKSSYDTLSDSEKNIFLDIACFFRGENVDYVMQLLDGCDLFPHVGVDVLVDKCLVTFSENLLQMHNLIQDVGREIINGETVHIERRRRLWEPWSIKYLLEDNEHKTTLKRAQGTEDIEGIFLDTLNLGFDVKSAAFKNMLNLRLLKIYCSNSEIHPVFNFPKGVLHSLPKELRLLHWENYPLQFLPKSFDPMHLVEINMPYSQLQKLWDGTKNLEMLRTIRLCHSQQLVDIDDLLKAQNLEVIDLQGCTRLQNFPATGQLLHLQVVNLSGCTKIKSFPEVPPNLETLHLQGTGITGLPLSIVKPNGGELESLLAEFQGLSDALKLERLTNLVKSSSASQDLGKLICLDLKDCSHLRSLPNMVNLEFLKVLDLSGCSELETIQGFPRNLTELYIAGTAVREVPQLPQSLKLLNAHGCVSLKSIGWDSEQLPVHYMFSNCFDLSPQAVNNFIAKALANVKRMSREHLQELNEGLAFSLYSPSHVSQHSTLDLQLGSSVMTRLAPPSRSTLVGFAMLVEVSFSKDFYNATGFGVSCVCSWKDKEGRSHRLERTFPFWAPGDPILKLQKDHLFVFCDVKMRPTTGEGNDTDILADLVVFEFFPVSKQRKHLDDSCTVTRCKVYVIDTATGNTNLKLSSPFSSSNDGEEVIRNKQTCQSEGYGFVEFVNRSAAEEVLQSSSGVTMPNADQPFRLNWASFSTGEKRASENGPDLSIFVGDLAPDVSDTLLLETFASRYPSVKSAKVVIDSNTGRPKGYGFVRFGDENERSRAMTEMHGAFCSSRQMRVSIATPKRAATYGQQNDSQALTLAGGHGGNGSMSNSSLSDGQSNNATIFVGGLDADVTEEDLMLPFSQFGEVVSVKIPVGKGCGFVQYGNRQSAEVAIEILNGTVIGKNTVRLSWGRIPNKQRRGDSGHQWNGGYSRGHGYINRYANQGLKHVC